MRIALLARIFLKDLTFQCIFVHGSSRSTIEMKSIQEGLSNEDRSFFTFILEIILGALQHSTNGLFQFYCFTNEMTFNIVIFLLPITYTTCVIFCRFYNRVHLIYFVNYLSFFIFFQLRILINICLRYTCSRSDPAIDVVDGPRKRHTIVVPSFWQAGSSIIFKKFILCIKLRILI